MAWDQALKGIRVSEAGSTGPNPGPLPQMCQEHCPQQQGALGHSGYSELRTPAPPFMNWKTQQIHFSKPQLSHLLNGGNIAEEWRTQPSCVTWAGLS